MLVRRSAVGGPSLARDHGHEAVAARIGRRETDETCTKMSAIAGKGVHAVAAAIRESGGRPFEIARRRAFELDRAGERAGAVGAAAAAAHHADPAEPARIVGGPGDPAAERIGLRHAVEDQQRPARGVAAQGAQGRALAGRVGGARVGAAELLESGHVAQHVLEPVRRRMIEPATADLGHVIGLLAKPRFEAVAGNDDLWLLSERGAAGKNQENGRETAHAARLQQKAAPVRGKPARRSGAIANRDAARRVGVGVGSLLRRGFELGAGQRDDEALIVAAEAGQRQPGAGGAGGDHRAARVGRFDRADHAAGLVADLDAGLHVGGAGERDRAGRGRGLGLSLRLDRSVWAGLRPGSVSRLGLRSSLGLRPGFGRRRRRRAVAPRRAGSRPGPAVVTSAWVAGSAFSLTGCGSGRRRRRRSCASSVAVLAVGVAGCWAGGAGARRAAWRLDWVAVSGVCAPALRPAARSPRAAASSFSC